jgi:capsular exopolysaccharide synthesis family protein
LVDADMRRPDMHRIFSRPLQGGMSELIMSVRPGENLSLRSARATSQPNLTLITAGTIPPNPSELLASRRAALLLHGLESAFDLVVVDTPPIDAVPDALNLAAEASATVVVVDAGRTNATQAQATIETLRSVGANVIGVVLNRAKEPRKPDYYYYYAEAPNEAGAQNRSNGNAPEPARLPAEYQRVAPSTSNGEPRESSHPVSGAAG